MDLSLPINQFFATGWAFNCFSKLNEPETRKVSVQLISNLLTFNPILTTDDEELQTMEEGREAKKADGFNLFCSRLGLKSPRNLIITTT